MEVFGPILHLLHCVQDIFQKRDSIYYNRGLIAIFDVDVYYCLHLCI